MNSQELPPARVLLVNFNTYDQPYPVYPVGLAYIEGALMEDGHVTEVWDLVPPGETLEETVRRFRPDVIGMSMRNIDNAQSHNPRSFTTDLLACVAKLRAESNAPLVVGGSGFSIYPERIFELSGVEYGIVGEGETAIRRLVRMIQGDGTAPEDIAGLVYRGEDGAMRMVPRSREEGFGERPYHHPPRLAAYTAEGCPLGMQTQRGCPLKCCYCTYPLIEGKRSRFRSGDDVAEELARMAAGGARQVFIVDSVFNTRASHVVEVCEAILRHGVKINWECFLRPGRALTPELMELMQRAGLNHIEFGSDSFCDPVLARYGKSFRWDEIRAVSETAHRLKIAYTHFIIFGGPGETAETMEETIARAATLPGASYFATIGMRVYPGTPLWTLATGGTTGDVAGEHLLEPLFYLEPPLNVAGIHARLREVQRGAPNWAVGDPPPAFMETLAKLRRRGKGTNMWEYVELMQRLGNGLQSVPTGAKPQP